MILFFFGIFHPYRHFDITQKANVRQTITKLLLFFANHGKNNNFQTRLKHPSNLVLKKNLCSSSSLGNVKEFYKSNSIIIAWLGGFVNDEFFIVFRADKSDVFAFLYEII